MTEDAADHVTDNRTEAADNRTQADMIADRVRPDELADRVALGRKADALGLILAQVGEEYQLHAGTPDVDQPEYASRSLADIERYLDRLIIDG